LAVNQIGLFAIANNELKDPFWNLPITSLANRSINFAGSQEIKSPQAP